MAITALSTVRTQGHAVLLANLHNAEAGTSDGNWLDTLGIDKFSIDIFGLSGETVQIRGSNASTKPADNTHGRQLGSDITSDIIVSLDTPVRWVKVRITVGGAGTVTAEFIGHSD